MRHTARQPMYPKPWQRWAWAAVPAASATALTFVPFVVAWRRQVVGWRTAAAYVALSLLVATLAVVQPSVLDEPGWPREVFRYALWTYLIVGMVRVALLDWPRKTRHDTVKQ